MVKGNTIIDATHPKRDCCSRGLILRKVLPMQQLFEVNGKVRGRQRCVKILKLGDSPMDGAIYISLSYVEHAFVKAFYLPVREQQFLSWFLSL